MVDDASHNNWGRAEQVTRYRVSETEVAEKTVEYHDTTVFGRILHPAAAAQQSAQNQDTVGD